MSLVFGRSSQILLNKFFDPSTLSMRKVDNEEKEKEKIMSLIVDTTNVVTS